MIKVHGNCDLTDKFMLVLHAKDNDICLYL